MSRKNLLITILTTFFVAAIVIKSTNIYFDKPTELQIDSLNNQTSKEKNNFRAPINDEDLKYWLENMVYYHNFTIDEIHVATGLSSTDINLALKQYKINKVTQSQQFKNTFLNVLPYPGGRHPRIGFLEGAIDPQRETKISVFAPWDPSSYVVVDIPEAIWSNLGLTYLAHTHVPTIWTQQNIELEKLEWDRRDNGILVMERTLPNGIKFGTKVTPHKNHVEMEMWLVNGTVDTLNDLRVQNCVMLKNIAGFQELSDSNKIFKSPFAATHSECSKQWVITAWEPCNRTWGNALVPCMHSDPKFPDCPPGETKLIRGWLSFYEGTDIMSEFKRISRIWPASKY